MKQIVFVVVVLIFSLSVNYSSLASNLKKEGNEIVDSTKMKVQKTIEGTSKKIENNKTQVLENKPINSVCPVSGEEIDPEITAVYKGKTYALCCKSCLKKFNKDPEKYVSKLSEDGKSLKKIK